VLPVPIEPVVFAPPLLPVVPGVELPTGFIVWPWLMPGLVAVLLLIAPAGELAIVPPGALIEPPAAVPPAALPDALCASARPAPDKDMAKAAANVRREIIIKPLSWTDDADMGAKPEPQHRAAVTTKCQSLHPQRASKTYAAPPAKIVLRTNFSS
jgi:hypothetical protein